MDVFTTAARHYLGAYLVELGGADVIVFTGGIGENSAGIRSAVCKDLSEFGIVLNAQLNNTAQGEARVSEVADMIAGGAGEETARAEARRLLRSGK